MSAVLGLATLTAFVIAMIVLVPLALLPVVAVAMLATRRRATAPATTDAPTVLLGHTEPAAVDAVRAA